jgi:chromatin segregation and condensation protein Rec8/ScpA/Scc1 (kleisin family)
LKEQSLRLQEIETINRFYRNPDYTEKDFRVALVNFSLPKLVEAFAKELVRADQRVQEIIPKKVIKDRFSVSQAMSIIWDTMCALGGSVLLSQLIEADFDVNDIVTTFLAALELMKYGQLSAEQEGLFDDILFTKAEDAGESLPAFLMEEVNGEY